MKSKSKYDEEYLINHFEFLERKYGRRPSKRMWQNDRETPSLSVVNRLFENWTGFLNEMGLKPLKPCEIAKGKRNRKSKLKNGYIAIYNSEHFSADKNKFVLEHRKVMSEFLNRKLSSDEHVHHKNGDKSDNRIENLQVLKISEHMKLHRKETPDLFSYSIGEENHFSKLTKTDVLEIRELYRTGEYTMSNLSKKYSVSPGTIHACIRKQTWKSVEENSFVDSAK